MADDPDDDAPPPPQNPSGTGERGPDGRFAQGNRANPGGRPASSKEFRQLARDYSPIALKKLYQIALTGKGFAAVRACEVIIERAWGKTPLEVSGPRGGPIDMRFHGAIRGAIEEAIAQAQSDEQGAVLGPDDPKN